MHFCRNVAYTNVLQCFCVLLHCYILFMLYFMIRCVLLVSTNFLMTGLECRRDKNMSSFS